MTNFYFAFILLLHYWAKHKHPCIYKSSHVIWLDSYTYIGNGGTTPLDLYVSWAQFLFACKTHWQVLRQILSWSLPARALHDLKNIGGRLSSLLSWFLFLHSDPIPSMQFWAIYVFLQRWQHLWAVWMRLWWKLCLKRIKQLGQICSACALLC